MKLNLFPSNNSDFKRFCETLNEKLVAGTGGRYNKKANWLSAQIASSLPNKQSDYNINTLKAELNQQGLMRFHRNTTPLYQVELDGKGFSEQLTHNVEWISVKSFLPNHYVLVDMDGKNAELSPDEFQFIVEGCEMHGSKLFDLIECNLPTLVFFEAEKESYYGHKLLELLLLDVDGAQTAMFRADGHSLVFYSIHDARNIWGIDYKATSGDQKTMTALRLENV